MGAAKEYFYTVDDNGTLETLDILYTNGDIFEDNVFIGHARAKDVQGMEVDITEEEYCATIRKYGSSGYEPLEDIGEERLAEIEWYSISDVEPSAFDKQ
jgi:hypothetical protein